MINFFRKVRKKFADDNQLLKYSRYAFGEIFLVVIGILIALQINNSNQDRIQKKELDDLMKSISNGIRSDIRSLNLISTARMNIGISVDSIFDTYIRNDSFKMNSFHRFHLSSTGSSLNNTIYFKPNLSAFESLKNSTYFGKLQGTDIEILLNAYFTKCQAIQKFEEEHNASIKKTGSDWRRKFDAEDTELIWNPWLLTEKEHLKKEKRYQEVLNDDLTIEFFYHGYSELEQASTYLDLKLIGDKFIEMVETNQLYFDEQTKLDFSGLLYSAEDSELINVFINGIPTEGFTVQTAADYISGTISPLPVDFAKDYIIFNYSQDILKWGVFFVEVSALQGRVKEMDLSDYSKVVVEMKGTQGGEEFKMTMKDILDPPDGSEDRVILNVTNEWKTYEVELNHFKTADMKSISMALGFIFEGPEGRTIHVRSIKFI